MHNATAAAVCACVRVRTAPVVFWAHQHGRKVKLVTVWFAFYVPCIQVSKELHHLHLCSFVLGVEGNHIILEHHICRWVNAPKWLHCAYVLLLVSAVLPLLVQI